MQIYKSDEKASLLTVLMLIKEQISVEVSVKLLLLKALFLI